jgi:hypothetical protein
MIEFAYYFEILVQVNDFRFLDYFINSKIFLDALVKCKPVTRQRIPMQVYVLLLRTSTQWLLRNKDFQVAVETYKHARTHTHARAHTHTRVRVRVCVYIYVCIYTHTPTHTPMHTHTHTHTHVCVCVGVYIYMFVCVYICICLCCILQKLISY